MEELMMTTIMIHNSPDYISRFDHKPIIDSTSPTWKLYQNPFYNHHHSLINNHLHYCLKLSSSSLVMDSDHVTELKAELEYERNLRKKLESFAKRLAKQLDEEREGREAMERLCQELAGEISSEKVEIDRMKKEMEEERKMMRLAEILREERVQMKLAEVKLLFEDKIMEFEDHMRTHGEFGEDSVRNFSGKVKQMSVTTEPARSMAVQRRASPEPENPHILRGIKGFVEFPRVIRAKGLKSRDSEAKLECQKAQLRVLLKQKGTVRSNNSLIIS